MSNYKTVFFIIGVLQIILGLFMTIPIILQLVFSELDSSFIASSVITLVFGILFVLSNLDYNKKINLQQAFLLTTLSWLTIAIFGALPFYFSNYYLIDPFKESGQALYYWSPIADELKSLDKKIVLNSIHLKWGLMKDEFKKLTKDLKFN